MLTIRLQRTGRKNHAEFRVVATESTTSPVSNKHVEILGNYNPHTNTASLKSERIVYWLGKGAQASDTAHNLLVTHKVITGKKRNVLPKNGAPAAPAAAEKVEETATPAVAEAPSETVDAEA